MKQVNQGIKFIDHPAPSRWISDRRAIAFVAASTVIMAYGGILGPVSILVFYAIWLPRIHLRGVPVVSFNRSTALSLLFAFWCCLSVAWSSYASTTLYSALEYASLIVCAMIMAERVRTKAFLKGVIYGSSITLIASLASGRYGVDPFTGNSSLVGLFGSKNMVGLFADILILSALLLSPNIKGSVAKAVNCLLPGILGLICLHQSKSATSVLALAATLAMLSVMYAVTRMPKNSRWITFTLVATWVVALFAVGHMLDWEKEILRAFGKSSNLTGRTDLWEKGIQYGTEHFLLGQGFNAFWVKGYLPAEHLWFKFGIYHRGGFHFHNLFVNTFVETGIVGATLVFLLLITTFAKAIKLSLRFGSQLDYSLVFAFTTLFSVRAFSEVDIVGTFGIGVMLFFSFPLRLAPPQREEASSSAAPSSNQMPHNQAHFNYNRY